MALGAILINVKVEFTIEVESNEASHARSALFGKPTTGTDLRRASSQICEVFGIDWLLD